MKRILVTATMVLLMLTPTTDAKDFSVTLSMIGVTGHGIKPGPWAAHEMQNKITKDGRFAYNPQLGVLVKTKSWQFDATYLRDCFDAHAGLLAAGPKLDLGNYFTVGSLFGVYGRKGRAGTAMPMTAKVKGIEVTPFAAGTFSFEVPVTKRVSLESNTALNMYVNHSNVGLKFKF